MFSNSVFHHLLNGKRELLASCFMLCCLIFTGCGGQTDDGPTRYQLQGTVSYDGKPVPKGEVSFRPDSQAGNKGPGGFAAIEQGKFQVDASKGVVGGPYIFTFTGFDGIPIPASDVGEPSQDGKPLFTEVEIKKDLPQSESTLDFEIPANKKK